MKRRYNMNPMLLGCVTLWLFLCLLGGSLPVMAAPNPGGVREGVPVEGRIKTTLKDIVRPLATSTPAASAKPSTVASPSVGAKPSVQEAERPLREIRQLQLEADNQAIAIAILKKKVNLSYQSFKEMLPAVKKQASRLTGDELVALKGAIERMTEQRTTVDALRDAHIPLLKNLNDARNSRNTDKIKVALVEIKKNQDSMTAALTECLNEFDLIKTLLPTRK